MTIRLPGMSCADHFIDELGRHMAEDGVRLVFLAPGFDAWRCLAELDKSINERGQFRFSYPMDEMSIRDGAQALRAVADSLRFPETSANSCEDLVHGHIDKLREPETVGLLLDGGIDAAQFKAIYQVCDELAELTKDVRGRLNFLLLSPDQPALQELDHASPLDRGLLWPALTPQPDQLSFEEPLSGAGVSATRLEQHGFEIYLSLRAYWEAGGAPDFLERLGAAHRKTAFWVANDAADQRIWQTFDELLAPSAAQTSRLSQVFEHAMGQRDDRAVFSTGLIQPLSDDLRRIFVASGLAWHPPGSYHLQITPFAARALVESGHFARRWELDQSARQRFRLACRSNPLIAAWVMSMSGLIEMEMLNYCKQLPDLDQLLHDAGMLQELEISRERSLQTLPAHYHTEAIDHASFGGLERLVNQCAGRSDFALRRHQIEKIRRARNLAAHRHPIMWAQVRVFFQALATLFAHEERFRPRPSG